MDRCDNQIPKSSPLTLFYAALYAKYYGLKTIVLDKSNFPRDKICGDALSGKCIRIMRELDLLKEIENLDGADINILTFGSPSYKQFDLDLKKSNKKGYVIPRLIFDNYLFQKVKILFFIKQKTLMYNTDTLSFFF